MISQRTGRDRRGLITLFIRSASVSLVSRIEGKFSKIQENSKAKDKVEISAEAIYFFFKADSSKGPKVFTFCFIQQPIKRVSP
jgi:hypothetical protein